MGVKGLQHFMESCQPDTCVPVDLKQMADQHSKDSSESPATIVVDGMACLRYWYRCQSWVHGGQWLEYMNFLQQFVSAFTASSIRLVFFFDGAVGEQKRSEWVRRRQKVNRDIARIFQHIKTHGQQPNSRELFCLPSGLATFSRFALKGLGQETLCTLGEGDYEIAEFALSNNCMGILGQDTDFVIFNTVPYLSINKLNLDTMTTVMFSREMLCHVLKLQTTDLPLLACLLGNDVVCEQQMQRLRHSALASNRQKQKQAQGEMIHAVANFIRLHHPSCEKTSGFSSLCLVGAEKEALEEGICAYLLPGQVSPWIEHSHSSPEPQCLMSKYVPCDILQAVKEKHKRADCFLIYNVLYDGTVECSNTLEDELEVELPPQAVLYLPVRERIYGLFLPVQPGASVSVKEWFVFPENPLKEPVKVTPKALVNPDALDLRALWFSTDLEMKAIRTSALLAIFDLYEFTEELKQFDQPFLAVICLVTYIATQVKHISVEDIDAYLSQAVCVHFKSFTEMQQLRTPAVDPRAVQLASLFVRGLTYLIAANSACGCPFAMADFMPWRSFDGLLFHSKYLQVHSGCPSEDLLEGNDSWLSLFLSIRELVLGILQSRRCITHSRPRKQCSEVGPMDVELHHEQRVQLHLTSRQEFNCTTQHQPGCEQGHRRKRRFHLAPTWSQSLK